MKRLSFDVVVVGSGVVVGGPFFIQLNNFIATGPKKLDSFITRNIVKWSSFLVSSRYNGFFFYLFAIFVVLIEPGPRIEA